MAIQIDPQLLASIVIPDSVQRAADDSMVHTLEQGLADLPAPFNEARIWVACREAWPHNDPDFEAMMFISVVIQGAHRYSQIGSGNVVETIEVRPGSVFATNPLALHWLEPLDPDLGFIALQWEVPHHEYEQRMRDLISAINATASMAPLAITSQHALVPVAPEAYASQPPGFPPLSSFQL